MYTTRIMLCCQNHMKHKAQGPERSLTPGPVTTSRFSTQFGIGALQPRPSCWSSGGQAAALRCLPFDLLLAALAALQTVPLAQRSLAGAVATLRRAVRAAQYCRRSAPSVRRRRSAVCAARTAAPASTTRTHAWLEHGPRAGSWHAAAAASARQRPQ
jgi:hypothetical protein